MAALIVRSRLIPDGKKIVPYSIQRLKRSNPEWFREDMTTLFDLLAKRKIRPIIADRIPLEDAARAHELLGQGSVEGRIILTCD